jgi:hypothetical protein
MVRGGLVTQALLHVLTCLRCAAYDSDSESQRLRRRGVLRARATGSYGPTGWSPVFSAPFVWIAGFAVGLCGVRSCHVGNRARSSGYYFDKCTSSVSQQSCRAITLE